MGSFALLAFCAWGMAENDLAAMYRQQVQPFQPLDNPSFRTSDVSIVLATIHPDAQFVRCLNTWLSNSPKEIIIVTIPRDVPAVKAFVARVDQDQDKIRILTADKANHRAQQIRGIKAATGSVIAMVDDDTFVGPDVLRWRIAALEDPKVAGVTGIHHPDIPTFRRSPAETTCWEAFSIRGLYNFNTTAMTRFGADSGVWCLIGCSQVLRAEVVQDPGFLDAFENQTWRGTSIRTGGDTWMTRLLMKHGHKLAFQSAPEATVYTTPKFDSGVVWQMARWLRSTHINASSALIEDPGAIQLFWQYPYMARKMAERMLRPIIALFHFAAWIHAYQTSPLVWLLITLWYMHQYDRTYQEFFRKFPWLGHHVKALFLYDTVGWFFLDMYVWATMAEETWVHKNGKTGNDGQETGKAEDSDPSDSIFNFSDEESSVEDFWIMVEEDMASRGDLDFRSDR